MNINIVTLYVIINYRWFSATGETVLYRDPHDFSKSPNNVESNIPLLNFQYHHGNFPPKFSQQVNHQGIMTQSAPNSELSRKPTSFLEDIFRAIDNMSEEREEPNNMRYAPRMPNPENQQATFGLVTPNLNQWTLNQDPSSPSITPLPMPNLSVLNSTSLRAENKMSGLISLALSFLTGSSQSNPLKKGLSNIVVNGIVKPLMVAKGGIKSIISKLLVPVVSLLLINLEVLITVWWLWEDCSKLKSTQPSNPSSENSNDNSNSSNS